MNFDDRLATVLATEVRGPHDRAVRWRQLVDLVARADPESSPNLLAQAIAALRAGRDQVAVPLRAAAARAIAGRALPTALLVLFAGDALEVAAPLLTGIAIDGAVLDAASSEVRRFLRAMNAETPAAAETQSGAEVPVQAAPPMVSEPVSGVPTIGDFVARIERLRNERGAGSDAPPVAVPEPPVEEEASPPPQESEILEPVAVTPSPVVTPPASPAASPARVSAIDETSPALFRWECGAGGEIGWVEGAPRGPLVGRSIARGDGGEGVDGDVERAFARRSPFRDAALALPDAGVVGGDWLISGVPAFAPADGRFVGYRGIARRVEAPRPDAKVAEARVAAPAAPLDPAALRELVHEIKTPLNAIIGFAEIIDGQYLGPAQTGYRTRAAEIVAQAHLLLGAIDDLDFAARLRGQGGRRDVAALDAFFAPLAADLQRRAGQRGATVVFEQSLDASRLPLDRELVERLVERFAGAALSSAGPGETLRFDVRGDGGAAVFSLSRPIALKDWSDSSLANGDRAAMALRLVAGLAQIVGGSLSRDDAQIVLRLPLVTAPVGPEGFEPPT